MRIRSWTLRTGWIAAALGILMIGQLLSALELREPETVPARLYTGQEPVYAEGLVIREEQLLLAPEPGSYVPLVADGERVAAGQAVLRWQRPDYIAACARRVRVLRAGQRQAALALETRRKEIHQAIAALNVRSGDPAAASETLTGLMLSEGELDPAGLEAAEQILRDQLRSPLDTVVSPTSGIFVSDADGLEEILTPEDPWGAIQLPERPLRGNVAGRLITGLKWYFRTVLPLAVQPGDTLEARLPGASEPVEMTVEAVRDGAVLLSCGRELSRVAAIRKITIKIIPKTKFALEIPAEALYTVEEETGVWCLVGQAERFKPVTVLEDLGDTLLVELDQTTTDTLWPGDRVILR